jgi:hypothetical protein
MSNNNSKFKELWNAKSGKSLVALHRKSGGWRYRTAASESSAKSNRTCITQARNNNSVSYLFHTGNTRPK